jgi:hypothetical protein
MNLTIQKYCALSPRKVSVNGSILLEVEEQDSLEKSLIQTYRRLELNYLKFFKMDNLSKLATLAAEIILKDTVLFELSEKNDMAVVLANASSSLATDANYQKTISENENYFPSPSLFVYTLPNITIGEICIKHKIYGENVFLVSQKFDADILHFYVDELFKNTNTQHCLTGWIECSENSYEGFLFLVGKGTDGDKFNVETINKLYITN